MNILARLHPLVIHFPVVLLFFYLGLEIINIFLKNSVLKKYSLIILAFGVISGIFAVLTGNLAFQKLIDHPNITKLHLMLIEKHELFASLTMWYFLALLVFQFYRYVKKKNESRLDYLFVIFIIGGVILLYKTAQVGGILVYKFGIGTDLL